MMPISRVRNSFDYGSLESPPSLRQALRVYTAICGPFSTESGFVYDVWANLRSSLMITGCYAVLDVYQMYTLGAATQCEGVQIVSLSAHIMLIRPSMLENESKTRKQHGLARAKYDDDR